MTDSISRPAPAPARAEYVAIVRYIERQLPAWVANQLGLDGVPVERVATFDTMGEAWTFMRECDANGRRAGFPQIVAR